MPNNAKSSPHVSLVRLQNPQNRKKKLRHLPETTLMEKSPLQKRREKEGLMEKGARKISW